MQVLIRYKGNVLGQIRESESITVGRDLENDIVIEVPQVSRHHAKLTLRHGVIQVEDLGSTHGVWQGRTKVRTAQFSTESEVGLGGAILQFDFSQYRMGTKTERIEESLNHETFSNEIKLGSAMGLALKTWPFMLTRFGILLAYSLGFVLWIAVWERVFAKLGFSVHPVVGFFILFAPFGIFHFLLRYNLYILKAGHIACLSKLVRGEVIPNEGMVSYGKRMVVKHFIQINVFFAIDALVKGITRQFNASLEWVSALLPIPGLQSIVGLVQKIVYLATTYIDEAVLSYNFSRKSDDVWQSSRDGIILYAQNSKQMLMAAVWAVVFEYALTSVLVVVCLAPAGFFMGFTHSSIGIATLILGILFASNIKAAFVHPILLSYMLLKYHRVIEGQFPDRIWLQNLERVSARFKDLSESIAAQNEPNRPAI